MYLSRARTAGPAALTGRRGKTAVRSEHVVACVEHLTWLEPAASVTAEQEAVWMGEDGEGRGGRFGCTCLAPCPGPIDQTAELAKGKGGGRERRQEMDKASVFF